MTCIQKTQTKMTLQAIGIGDLHLDGKLAKYIPDCNAVIIGEVKKIIRYADKKGVSTVILYGDICDGPVMSADAHIRLTEVFLSNPHIEFIIIKGNHDVMDSENCSLDYLKFLSDNKAIPNLHVALKPEVLFEDTATPVNLLPWPAKETRKDCLNVMHTEAAGTTWETGRQVTGGFLTNHLCVVGHVHKAQSVRNSHFSGTTYQVSFGEPQEKFFHHIKWTGNIKTSSVELVPHKPTYTLVNKVISKASEIDELEDDPYVLYKVFVKKSVILPNGAFNGKPNVVKTNYFANKEELKALIIEELVLDDVSSEVLIRHDEILSDWLTNNKVSKALAERVKAKFKLYQEKVSA